MAPSSREPRAHGSRASSSSHISSSEAGPTSTPAVRDRLRGSRSAGPIGTSPAPLSRYDFRKSPPCDRISSTSAGSVTAASSGRPARSDPTDADQTLVAGQLVQDPPQHQRVRVPDGVLDGRVGGLQQFRLACSMDQTLVALGLNDLPQLQPANGLYWHSPY